MITSIQKQFKCPIIWRNENSKSIIIWYNLLRYKYTRSVLNNFYKFYFNWGNKAHRVMLIYSKIGLPQNYTLLILNFFKVIHYNITKATAFKHFTFSQTITN